MFFKESEGRLFYYACMFFLSCCVNYLMYFFTIGSQRPWLSPRSSGHRVPAPPEGHQGMAMAWLASDNHQAPNPMDGLLEKGYWDTVSKIESN